jgi:hypothetical protein
VFARLGFGMNYLTTSSETLAVHGGVGLPPLAGPNLLSTRKAHLAHNVRDEVANSVRLVLVGIGSGAFIAKQFLSVHGDYNAN